MIRNRLILILLISLFAGSSFVVGSVPEERRSLAENREINNVIESTENESTDDSNWPTYQHDFQRTGYTDEEGPVSNKTMWVRNIGISTAPVIWNGRIYFGTWFNRLYCLDAMSGEEIWNFTVGDHIWSTPTVWGGRVYFGCEDRNLYCLDAMSGEKIWNRTFPNVIGTSVAIWNNKIYVYVLERTLYCLDADSGEELWKFNGIALSEWASPAVYGGYVIFCSDMVYCLDAESGRMIWSYGIDGGTRATATIYDGKVYIGGDGWKFYCLNLTDGKVIWWKDLENVVIFPPAVHDNKVYVLLYYLHCYNASNGEEIWSCEALDGAAPSLSSNGYVYYINARDGKIVCVDSEDGKKVWSYDCESPYIGYVSIWDGKLYAASSVGVLYCFGNLKPIANFSYEPAQVKSGEEIR
ncbi:MAG: PQQ-like beta-propeller repeat protein, partial [Thermoplasmata archaeon]|nr:PQQ-like beta-propeller repeat protein [Thermoplasmata archaeon]